MKKTIITSLATLIITGSAFASNIVIESETKPVYKIYNNIETANIKNYSTRNGRNTISMKEIQILAMSSDTNMSFDDILKKAEAERKRTKSVAGEWTTVSQLISAAKKDYKAGKENVAKKKLHTAIDHARIGYDQAIGQRGAGPRF